MCRILGYFGPPLRLSALLIDPSHSLQDQSRAAREMHAGSVAGDGWGVGWFAPEGGDPGLFKNILPMWSDENVRTGPHAITSGCLLGHVRLASPGVEVCLTNTPLYALDEYLFTANGEMSPWPGPLARALRARLDGADEANVRGFTDAEMLGALWRTCLRRTASGDMGTALARAIEVASELAMQHASKLSANLLVASRSGMAAIRFAQEGKPNSLYYLTGEERFQRGSMIASEPLDDGLGWRRVPENSVVRVDRNGVQVEPLASKDGKERVRSSLLHS